DGDKLYDWLMKNKNTKRINPAQLKVPLQETGLMKFATRADLDVLRKLGDADVPDFRFYDYISRNGMPPNFLLLNVQALGDCYDTSGWGWLMLEAPALQLGIVVLENITDKPVELGNFYFRMETGSDLARHSDASDRRRRSSGPNRG